jgi:hypothetical protein
MMGRRLFWRNGVAGGVAPASWAGTSIATSDPAFAARLKHDLFEADFTRSYELNHAISVDWADFLADTVLEAY